MDYVVLLREEGVFGLATRISDGISCTYYCEGVEYVDTFTEGEYLVLIDL